MEEADKEIHGPDQIKWFARLEKETDNFRAALDWCVAGQNTEMALRLLRALSWAWLIQGQDGETRSWFDKIRALPEIDAYPALYARLLNQIGRASWLRSDFHEARSILEESQALWLKLGVAGECGLAEAMIFLGMVAQGFESDYHAAQVFYDRSLELYQKHRDQWGMAFALFNSGFNAYEQHDDVPALAALEQGLDLFGQLGDVWGMARSSQILGRLFLKQGNYEEARVYFEQHLRLDEGLQFKLGTIAALYNLGDLHRYQGDDDQAACFYEKSLMMSREYGYTWDLSYSVWCLGLVALHRNDYRLARQQFIDCYSLARTMYSGGVSECNLFTGLAAVAAGTNQPERAGRLHGAGQARFETTDYRFSPFDRAEFDRHMQIAREQLGEEGFAALAAEGRALTTEQAIELALSQDASHLPSAAD